MKKVFSIFAEAVFWLQLFIAPFAIGALVATALYIKNERLWWLAIGVWIIAFITGIVYAERVRRTHGASMFMSKRLETPDLWPNTDPEEKTERGGR